MKTYQPDLLDNTDPTNQEWARTWARKFAGDYPNEAGDYPADAQDDAEWNGWLEATKSTVYTDGTLTVLATYYRPHLAAAEALRANPYWLKQKTVRGYTEEYQDIGQVAARIEKAGAWIDAIIERTERVAGRKWSGGTEWRVSF